MKKSDIILIIGIIVVAATCLIFFNWKKEGGDQVVVFVGGQETNRYPLNKDKTVTIEGMGGENVLQIKDGAATLTEADCPDQLCVHQQDIKKDGEMIVCLPHQILIQIEAKEASKMDSVAN